MAGHQSKKSNEADKTRSRVTDENLSVNAAVPTDKQDSVVGKQEYSENCDVTDPTRGLKLAWQFITEPKHSNAVVAIFTVLIFLTGAIYAIFAYLQWSAANGQLEQMKSGNRPWVGIEPDNGLKVSEIRIGEKEAASVTMTVTIKNFGSYPGRNVVALAWLMVVHDSMYQSVVDKIKVGICLTQVAPICSVGEWRSIRGT